MRIQTHDENGYPLNFDPSNFYSSPEIIVDLLPELYNTEPGRYSISTWGRLYDNFRGTYVPKTLSKQINDYCRASITDINGNTFSVPIHRIVAEMFNFPKLVDDGNKKKVVPNHKDGVKWHNEPSNLEWVTQSDNAIHAENNNLNGRCHGEDNGYSELSDDQYREICRLLEAGFWPYQINTIMNLDIDITNIAQKIKSGKTGKIFSDEFDFSNAPKNDYRKFSEDQVRYICKTLQDSPETSYNDILINMGYDIDSMSHQDVKKLRDSISTIKRRKSYTNIGKEYNF